MVKMAGVVAASLNTLRPNSPASTLVDLPPQPKRPDSVRDVSCAEFDIFRYTPIPTLIVDASRKIVQVSDSFLMTSQGRREDFVGRRADDVFEQPELPMLASARELLRAAEGNGSPSQVDHLTDLQQVWRTRAVPIFRNECLHCTQLEFQEVTEEHRRSLELEERLYTNETFRILVETVKDYAIFMLDPDGNIATWNAGAQAFKGYTKSEIIGQHFSRFYSEEDLAADKPGHALRDAIRDGRCEDEGWVRNTVYGVCNSSSHTNKTTSVTVRMAPDSGRTLSLLPSIGRVCSLDSRR